MMQLLETSAHPDPVVQFHRWFTEAEQTAHPLPEGMALATVGADGRPSLRIVLLKGLDQEGARFFTNYNSRKSRELLANPKAALVLWWPSLQRQVRIEGDVVRLSAEQSDAYHGSRPRSYQLGAWASPQSNTVTDRAELEAHYAAMHARFAGAEVPRPPHWGGFLLRPTTYEFWQGRDCRMHDRLCYEPSADGWQIRRLAP